MVKITACRGAGLAVALCAAVALTGCSQSTGAGVSSSTEPPSATPPSATPPSATPPSATPPSATPPKSPLSLGAVAWKAAVRGAVYAEPVVAGNRVFVVTEDDDVYALSLATGKVLWHTSVGKPLTHVAARAGCGDIDPLGITSTPVVDAAGGTLYVVGEVSGGGLHPRVHRELVGFDTATGRVVRRADADPTGGGDRQINLLQRAGLVLDHGRVDVGFGGLYGDCGYYHGWVVGVSTTAGVPNLEFDTTAGGSGGAIWQGGAPPAIGTAGSLYVVTGNPNGQGTAGDYESVVKLSASLVPEASFRDPAATGDEDFGTSGALLLPGKRLFAVGKTDIGYVLERSDLDVVARIPGVCGSNPDGRLAFDAGTDMAYVPCRGGGIQEVDLRTLRLGWKAGAANSSPIMAEGSLWALAYPSGVLEALDPATGAVEQRTEVGEVAPFATPAYGAGRLVVGTATGTVEAFGH